VIEAKVLEWLQREIDGDLTAGERTALAGALADSPAARAHRDGLRRLARLLDAVPPAEPPAGFENEVLDAVARLRTETTSRRRPAHAEADRQACRPLGGVNNIAKSKGGYPMASSQRTFMNKKVLSVLVGGVAAAAVTVAYYDYKLPADEAAVAGTIVAAKRYRGEQMTASDVKLGEVALQNFIQSDSFNKLVNDPQFRALAQNPEFMRLARDPALLRMAQDPAFRQFAQDPALRQFAQDPAFRQFAQDPAFRQFAQDPAFRQFAQDPSALRFAQDPAFRQFAQDPAFLRFAQDPAFLKFAQDPAALRFAQDPAFLKFAQDPAALRFAQDPAALRFAQDPAALRFAQDPAFAKFANDAAFAARAN